MNTYQKLIEISSLAFRSEDTALKSLYPFTQNYADNIRTIAAKAKDYIITIRNHNKPSVIEEFIQEYNLTNEEGIAIMCLAEALLRIPDTKTMDQLIADKCSKAKWYSHFNKSGSKLVNAASFGLSLAGKILNLDKDNNIFGALIRKSGEPIIRSAFKRAISTMGSKFVIGESIEEALTNAKKYPSYLFSYDILGEGARNKAQAEIYFNYYLHAIEAIGATIDDKIPLHQRTSISVKLSALHPRYELLKQERLVTELLPTLKHLLIQAQNKGINVTIDAEEASRLDISLILFTKLFADDDLKSYDGLGLAVQAYQKRAASVISYLAELASIHKKKIPVRLVKGAYWDSEIKRAQYLGLEDFPVFTQKYHTDFAYLACARKLLEHNDYLYPQFATHNAMTAASIITIGKGKEFEFQRLYGMGEHLHDHLISAEKIRSRIYAPVGTYQDLLCYLIRRLIENGANSSFVHLFIKHDIPISELTTDPVNLTIQNNYAPSTNIASPKQLFGTTRKNSSGIDFGNANQVDMLKKEIAPFNDRVWEAAPIISGAEIKSGEAITRRQPGDINNVIGKIWRAEEEDCQKALRVADEAFANWSLIGATARASILRKIADLYEQHQPELLALLIKEAGKTISDGIAEVKEAIDFCRYYASEAERLMNQTIKLQGYTGESNGLTLHSRGVFICISPWNFPLAIFTGQIAAALVTGNTVIAKPSEQTPLISALAIKLMHQAGIPHNALHLLIAKSHMISNIVLTDARVAGVAFTGSTATARNINRTLATREDGCIAPLIAETGGQNCMIVDSSALLEQTVDDIMISAFGSTGQRCSALRVLYIQNDIADKLITMLAGAMAELDIGDTNEWSVDIGPVIDKNSRETLHAHIAQMKATAKLVAATPINKATASNGYFVQPHAFQIKSIQELKQEVFGPILHIIRFKSNELEQVIADINSTGYGLTLGIQTRITDKMEYIRNRVKTGNIYVNRSMIGAMVGVQPFGGEGLSGTGPKAGGPHYLQRFCTERCYTVNTAAIGGNLELFVR